MSNKNRLTNFVYRTQFYYMKRLFYNIKASIIRRKSNTETELGKFLLRNALKISTAESCTGGLISSRLTDVSGSSAYIRMNFVTYSNDAKMKILNVSEETLLKYGAVSQECAYEMAQGLQKLTGSDIVLCTTGIAGPTGDKNKPIGLIYVAVGYKDKIEVREFNLNPHYNRKNMKFMFSECALKMVLDITTKYFF